MNVGHWTETVRQDVRVALRVLRGSPLFFGATVLTLALGIGANGAVFSILQSVLLQRLPYDDPSRLVLLSNTSPDKALPLEFSGPMAISVRDAAAGRFGEVAAALLMHNGSQLGALQGDHLESALDVVSDDRVTRLNGASVTPNFFRVLGVRAAIGRTLTDADADATTEIVLSDETWRREFGGDPSIVGHTITASSGIPRTTRTLTVLGVLPRGVHFTYPGEIQAWVMMPWSAVARSNPYAGGEYTLISRIRPGLSVEHARKLLWALPRNPLVAPADARHDEHARLDFISMHDWIVGDTRPSLYLLGGVAALLLIVTCVTVANGLLARISERQQELAVRSALGAGRSRVLQQLLVEGALLTATGTVAGTLLAIATQPILRALLPSALPRVGESGANATIVVFAGVMAVVTTILAVVAPAWSGTREGAAATLTRAASVATAGRSTVSWRHTLVGAQAALTTLLLIFSGLLLTSLWRLGQVPLGFDPHDVLAVNVQLLGARYLAPGAMGAFGEDLLRGVRGIPGVVTAGITSAIPFRGFDSRGDISVQGRGDKLRVRVRYVDSAFFAALRVPALRGRLLSDDDRENAPAVTVISESLARSAFGAANPIGRVLQLSRPTEIVGVVGDMRYNGLDKDPSPAVYVPTAQFPRPLSTLVVRTRPGIARPSLVEAIRRVIHDVDPTLAAVNIATVDAVVDATIAGRRFYSVAAGAFAILALSLTTVGLALVVARAVAERRRELAIRSALGATFARLSHAAVGDAMIAICSGVVIGILFASIGSIGIAQFLFQVTAHSSNAYAGSAALVIGIACAAAYLPMRRFAELSLAELLRQT